MPFSSFYYWCIDEGTWVNCEKNCKDFFAFIQSIFGIPFSINGMLEGGCAPSLFKKEGCCADLFRGLLSIFCTIHPKRLKWLILNFSGILIQVLITEAQMKWLDFFKFDQIWVCKNSILCTWYFASKIVEVSICHFNHFLETTFCNFGKFQPLARMQYVTFFDAFLRKYVMYSGVHLSDLIGWWLLGTKNSLFEGPGDRTRTSWMAVHCLTH